MKTRVDKSMSENGRRKKERFSKQIVVNALAEKAFYLMNKNHFNPDNGWSQVEGKGEEINREYGEFVGMIDVTWLLEITREFWIEISRLRHEKIEYETKKILR